MDRSEWLKFPCVTLADKREGRLIFQEHKASGDTSGVRKSTDLGFAFLNVIVESDNVRPEDLWLFAGKDGQNDEEVMIISAAVDIFDLLIMLKAFPSKGQARKNWKHGDCMPKGWNEFKVGKFKHHLCIWNPQETGDEMPEV